jgi:hypothetical protein
MDPLRAGGADTGSGVGAARHDGGEGDVGAIQTFFGTYSATGSVSATDQTSSDTDVDACGALPSSSVTGSWGYAVSAGNDSGTVLITDEGKECSFPAHQDAPGVFSAVDVECMPLSNSPMIALDYRVVYHSLVLDVPRSILRGEEIHYWYNPLYGDLMSCSSFDLRLSS